MVRALLRKLKSLMREGTLAKPISFLVLFCSNFSVNFDALNVGFVYFCDHKKNRCFLSTYTIQRRYWLDVVDIIQYSFSSREFNIRVVWLCEKMTC